jgi:hypothetical protein
MMIHRIDHRMAIAIPGTNGVHKKTMMEYFRYNFGSEKGEDLEEYDRGDGRGQGHV